MDEPVYIRQKHRDRFEASGIDRIRDEIMKGLLDGEERIHALAWIDDKEHGADCAHKAEQLRLAQRSDRRGVITMWTAIVAIALSVLSLALSIELRFPAFSGGRSAPAVPSPATPAPEPSQK
jgi:hypothetical protein